MVTRRGLVACALVMLTASCKGDTPPSAAEDRLALDRDIAAWAEPFGAAADWKIGPFTVQVEDALQGKRLLLKGVAVADVIRRDGGHHVLLGSNEAAVLFEESNVPANIRFLVACSNEDASALLARSSEIASMNKLWDRVSIDAIVEVVGVRRVSTFDLEASPEGDSAYIETVSRNRFVATGELVAFRVRPHPL